MTKIYLVMLRVTHEGESFLGWSMTRDGALALAQKWVVDCAVPVTSEIDEDGLPVLALDDQWLAVVEAAPDQLVIL